MDGSLGCRWGLGRRREERSPDAGVARRYELLREAQTFLPSRPALGDALGRDGFASSKRPS